jgi:mannose-1-phosphate guanylyltransferase/phosphomannomutase
MKAVIMAGGEGTRLRPLTSNQPKPMMPLANRPMMEHIVRLLKLHGFDDIVVTVAFLANVIRNYFGDGSDFGVRMVYATEEHPLGTAGSVRNAMDELHDESFLVISGDVLTDVDLTAVVDFHKQHAATATIALKAMENPVEFGIVITNPDGEIERFLEKPTWGQVFSDTINTGIYVLEPSIFDHIPEDRQVDFAADVFPKLLGNPETKLFGYVADGYWEDVGTLEAYSRAHLDVLDGKVAIGIPGFDVGGGVWLGEGAEIHPSATLTGPCVIGDFCRIEANASLREYTVLGSNVNVGPEAYLERAVVHDNSYLGGGVRLRGCVVGRSSDLRKGARAEEGVVLGDECFVGEHAVLNPNVKVYPFKTVEANAIINSSIVWESRGARHLFGRMGVAGLANVDISPELALRVAMAYGTTLKKGSTVVTSRDTSRAARTLKRAIMVGLNAAGVHVEDLELAPVPVTRFHLRAARAAGGVTVRLHPDDPQSVVIRFFDSTGIDIDESAQRKIERLFYREDFRRAFAADIGEISFPGRVLEFYTAGLMATVDVEAIRAAGCKVVLDYAYGSASLVMPNVLAKLGADVLAVNPYAATAGAAAFDRRQQSRYVAELVRTSRATLGAVIDPDGEHITLIDDTGRVLTDDQALFVLLSLVCTTREHVRAVLPVSVSRSVERFAAEQGAVVRWAKLSAPHLMEEAATPHVTFAANRDGGYIWPDFLPAYDAPATLVNVLAMLARRGVKLSKIADEVPPVHTAHEVVPTPWEQKGLVMRNVMERAAGHDLVLVDGIKVCRPDGWVLVLPDPEHPTTHVWAEADTPDAAAADAAEWARAIRQLLRG